jgi:predicted nucleotidyltransferase
MHDAIARVVDPFLTEVDAALGSTYTAILFGSAARGDHVPGRSDLNLMLIVERADAASLARLRPAFARWRKAAAGLPLIISRDEWLHGVDVFPIEICDLRAAHQVLRGPDLVSQVRADPADLGLLGFDPAPLLRVLACRTNPKTSLAASDFEAYVAAVERAATFTDQLELGGQHS